MESTQSHPGSSHDALARPAPLTVPDSPLHPHPHSHHYDPVTVPVPVSTNPPFGLDPALHLPNARPHHNGNSKSGPALHLPDSPPGRATFDKRDHGQQLSQPYAAHEPGRDVHYTLPLSKFSHPHPHAHSPVDINGHAHEHDSWRPYAESKRSTGVGTAGTGVGAPLKRASCRTAFLLLFRGSPAHCVCHSGAWFMGLCSPSDVHAFPLLTEGYIHPRFLFNSGAARLQLNVSTLRPPTNEPTIALRVSKVRFSLHLGGGDLEGGIEGEANILDKWIRL
ncbi:hypothetical protein B0H13DRAFT_2549778 [Mycena leptocephala]|nr:hypothetical protein B0H13DRAFT_2549778 [Mycena leptocephala]